MIPVLWEKDERGFRFHGLGSLPAWLECKVVESRGEYYLEGTLPVGAYNVDNLAIERIITAAPAPGKRMQPFRIRKLSKTMNDRAVHVLAHHVSYELVESITKPPSVRTKSGQTALEELISSGHMVPQNNGRFAVLSDITATDYVQVSWLTPKNTRASIGDEGGVADLFDGDIEWDGYTVKLTHRGRETDKVIRYGRNLSDLAYDTDVEGIVNGLYGYWRAPEGSAGFTDAIWPDPMTWPSGLQYPRIQPVDLSSELEPETGQLVPSDAAMYAALEAKAAELVNNDLKTSITVNAVPADLQDVFLYDVVTVIHPGYDIRQRARIVETQFDPIRERYISLTIGERVPDITDSILAVAKRQKEG